MLRKGLETWLAKLLGTPTTSDDYRLPAGAPALLAPDSVSWQIFKNPVTVFIGGVAAVVLELAEPRVRTGVWQFTSFRDQPLARLRHTGAAAMLTVYGPRPRAEAMIAGVVRRHARIHGVTPDGQPFHANDPELLEWVHATASFGFLQAYHRYAHALDRADGDRFCAEGQPIAARYGAADAPGSLAALHALIERTAPRLQRSAIVFEFLHIACRMPALPRPLRPLQALLVKAAVALLPPALHQRLGLDAPAWQLSRWQHALVRALAGAADRLVLRTHPAVQASRRLGLPDAHLYRQR